MTINLTDDYELVITINPDNSCRVDHYEAGYRLGTEVWRSLSDVLEEYC